MGETSENYEDEKMKLFSEMNAELLRANKRCLLLDKIKRVLWWAGFLLLLFLVLVEWVGGDLNAAFCGVLTHFPPPCDGTLEQDAIYMFRFALVMSIGFFCWIAVIVANIIQISIRSVYSEVDSSFSWRSVLAFITSLLVLSMAYPVVIIIMFALDI